MCCSLMLARYCDEIQMYGQAEQCCGFGDSCSFREGFHRGAAQRGRLT